MTTVEYRDEARRLYYDDGTPEACAKARDLFLKAAEDKDIISAVSLGGIAYDANDFEEAKSWWNQAFDWYKDNPSNEAADYVAFAHARFGDMHFYNYEERDPVPDFYRQSAVLHYTQALEMGCDSVRNELGQCLYEDDWMLGCKADINGALKVWKEGMEQGDHSCALRYCAYFIDNDTVDQRIIDILEGLVRDEEDPCADACALLYQHYAAIGEDELAVEWMECGIDMGSELMENILAEEREREIGEDDWTASEPVENEKCVIVVDTNGGFRIEHADASDWRNLPKLIDADRTDNLRCSKFTAVSKMLKLKGTLLGMLDRDAFRKPDLELNWHASQWYDGMADLAGDLIICLEDSRHEPYSFSSEAETQRVIDALRG